jgi:hypothetical protein
MSTKIIAEAILKAYNKITSEKYTLNVILVDIAPKNPTEISREKEYEILKAIVSIDTES